ncbi:E3 ubiquitin-protein ligase PIB1 [Candida viswanathii]|uniref:RING-type E3 ubiquitin transferase n=1 Tax=Candida viswanathii TaxID=5486 RepID=A0A367YJA7_9ASCO|nr:E3 ubiquitin-protein ligase PIB1 [Candida viswanathii]
MTSTLNNEDTPVWQDDYEVTKCFLCNKPYNIFFNRRHHCRKCGKVVCGDCSQQFITYFPNTPIINDPDIHVPQFSRSNTTYRTCDRCAEETLMIRRALFNENTPHNPASSSSSSNNPGVVVSGASSVVEDNNSIAKHANIHQHTRNLHNSTPSLRQIHDLSSDSNLCPVCATDLLKLYIENIHSHTNDKDYLSNISNENFENFKEFHINECLINFDFDTKNSNRFSPDNLKTLKNKMLVYNIPPIPKPTYESIGASSGDDGESSSVPREKSKEEEEEGVGYEDENECVICLESLKPGDKVGRLECLCVFHYKCIKDWFNKKGYGECPVHFLHK